MPYGLRKILLGGVIASGTMGCVSGLASLAPRGFAPVERSAVDGWIETMSANRSRLYQVRPWRYRNERGAASGRATIRVAPPDSLRFDYRGPFGRSGNAVIIGDSTLWSSGDDLEELMLYAPVFWASLGLPQRPPRGAQVTALIREDFRAWRYIVAGDTVDFILRGSPAHRLDSELRRAGRVLAQGTAQIDTLTGLATSAQLDFWNVSRFEFTVEAVDTIATFDDTVWQQR